MKHPKTLVFLCFLFAILLSNISKAQPNFQYVYDEIGQLKKAIDNEGNVLEYVYDEVGNILEIKRSIISGLAILDFNPKQGPVGTKVTIQGRGFSSIQIDNSLEFNGTPASVDTATDIQLETTVPLGATTGPLSVTVAGVTAISTDQFVVVGVPEITSINPPGGLPGQLIPNFSVAGTSLQGSEFLFIGGANPPNAVTSPIINTNGTSATMTVTVDPNASGLYAVQANNGSGSSSNVPGPANTFRILNPSDDEDNDGLTNAEEAANGTDIFNADTDGDGFSDKQEIAAGTDPLTFTTTISLACGALLSNSIDAAGKADFFSFSGNTNDVIDLMLTETSNWGGNNFANDARLTLFSPTGVQVALFDSNAQTQLTLPETGTYLIRVNANNLVSTGNYNLGLSCVLPSSPPPTPIACGDNLSGSIDAVGKAEFFSFSGNTNDVIDLMLTETSNWGGNNFANDARLTLFSPTGVQVALFDSNAQTQLTLPETGTYLIRVNANNLVSTGNYNLGLSCVLPPSPPPTPIACGDLHSGSIDAAGEAKFLSFTGNTNDVIDLMLTETSNWGGNNGANDARATLYSPTGGQVALFDSNAQSQLTETGTYLIRINANNLLSIGSFDVGLSCVLPPNSPPTSIALGETLSSNISTIMELDAYTFNGNSGDDVTINMVTISGGLDPRIRVFRPDGSMICSGALANSGSLDVPCSLDATGVFTIIASDNGDNETGDYELSLNL